MVGGGDGVAAVAASGGDLRVATLDCSADAARLAWEGEPAKPMQFLFTLLSALVMWTAFALSPLAGPVLGGKPRPIDHAYSPETPHSVAKFLREQPPKGLVWAPDDWSDWWPWDGPPGLKIAANSNAGMSCRSHGAVGMTAGCED